MTGRFALLVAALLAGGAALAAEPLPFQPLVDATPEGGTLEPPPGIYAGPVVISRAIAISGNGKVILTGQGRGTVLDVKANGTKIEGLEVQDSGHAHEAVDTCIRVEANFNVIKDNLLHGCLFGITLQHADNNIIRRNRVKGTMRFEDLRGDGIRVWYSHGNKVESNVVTDHRDVIIEYSHDNVVKGNSVSNGRYGTHFMYSSNNIAEDNTYAYNTVGVFSMYSNNLQIRHNKITRGNGPAAMGIGLKEASGLTVEDNDIDANSVGVYLDQSPLDSDNPNNFRGNRFAFNGVALLFHNDCEGDSVFGNDFIGNHSQVIVQGGGGALSSRWEGNYWDTYEGFDHGKRGFGDSPFEVWAYADRLWVDVPPAAFFRGSPMMEALDFLARLAPFSKPRLILRDPRPAMHEVAEQGRSQS
ncbi:MAG TPA: nitrous oxide reductase family maturation protein NosD [Candidatus Sulfotelmatobacter sp.]|nr:nitrous oxide reductase family maturation protein NosD [Candidatus Sulfotelmatobacter sp.]